MNRICIVSYKCIQTPATRNKLHAAMHHTYTIRSIGFFNYVKRTFSLQFLYCLRTSNNLNLCSLD